MEEATNYHTAEQNQQKRDAIDSAVRELAFKYIRGSLASRRDIMYHEIDNLHALLTELRRG